MEKGNVLFIPASIRSHIIPSFYLANILSEQYTINYLIANDTLEELVKSQGYNAVNPAKKENKNTIPNNKNRFIKYLISEAKLTAFNERSQIIKSTINTLQPSIVIVDIFAYSDLAVLHHFLDRFKIAFFNPMVSTYLIEDYPTVAGKKKEINKSTYTVPLINYTNPKYILNRLVLNYKTNRIKSTYSKEFKKLQVQKGVYTQLYESFPEFVAAPLEFEYDISVKKANQIYLGLCTTKQRVDIELDMSFEARFEAIKHQKKKGEKLIYCSFGTFYSGSNLPLLNFLKTLMEAVVEIPNIQFICAVNDIVSQTLIHQKPVPNNVHFFSRTPQLRVLEYADLHVTHGGFSSIKESISNNVPMLVYPLDLTYDQYGNSLKVEYHKIGLKGTLRTEQAENLRNNILTLLHDNTFKENIRNFNSLIEQNYQRDKQRKMINNMINV